LTFVGSGWSVISKTISFATGSVYSEAASEIIEESRYEMEDAMDELEDEEGGEAAAGFLESIMGQAETMVGHQVELALNDLILSLVTLFGAILMFRMSRKGYFLYVFGAALQFIVPLFIVGYVPILFYTVLFINGLFIGLYSTQLKHLA
ncbi:MAG: hypothetical protein ACPF8V_07055, partial [Luteibaculum sp.]